MSEVVVWFQNIVLVEVLPSAFRRETRNSGTGHANTHSLSITGPALGQSPESPPWWALHRGRKWHAQKVDLLLSRIPREESLPTVDGCNRSASRIHQDKMEAQVERLADKAWGKRPRRAALLSHANQRLAKLQQTSLSARVLIAVSGIPGSGKTTLALTVAKGVNDRQHADFQKQYPNSPASSPSQPDVASVVPLDGYHLTRKQLNEMPNAEEAVFRRGAAFTFDGEGFVKLVEKLRKPMSPETKTIYAPSFDHSIRDPVENDIGIAPTTRMVIFEGLYTALDKDPWREAAKLMDELWFVEVDMDVAIARLVKRHVGSGISPDAEHARKRIMQSDMRNGKEILEFRLPVQEIVQSREDEEWKSSEIKQAEQEEKWKPRTLRMGSIAEMADSGVGL